MLKTKSMLAPIEPSDGIRVSVMSRHTLNDGKTPHPKITPDHFDGWMQALAPHPTLIGGFYKRGLCWEAFERQYVEYILHPNREYITTHLAWQSTVRDITILCVEEEPKQCHRRLLAETCKILVPELEIYVA